VGGDQTYSIIDRKAMWHWLGRLKQPDGGFQICEGGEEDTRGAYCALVVISLLDLPLDLPPGAPARASGLTTFNDGLGAYISRCQTYEGGIAGSPGNEAHGAYVFCALGCLSLLGPPQQTFNTYLDLGLLIAWMSSRQYAPEGGLAGRTNKLVDGCYSHWIGGCWPLVQAALNGPFSLASGNGEIKAGNLYSAEGLARYILCCCQAPHGGLRDKPSK
jgi:protein farnesyltransferase subunit beta